MGKSKSYTKKYPVFTEDMKKDYTILIPSMLPRHFNIMSGIMRSYGYKTEILENMGQSVIDEGLKYVHNDTCYPAQLVIGQMLDALNSGKYDKNKVALMITQTGGGCRASNYIHLLRKALEKAGYGYIPVVSLNFSGLEKESSFKMTPAILHKFAYAICYGDLLMTLVNQSKPYEVNKGDSEALASAWTQRLTEEMRRGHLSKNIAKNNYLLMAEDFAKLEKSGSPKPKVGIVGEIFVKFSPLGNNNLEEFLISEGAEPVVPGLLDFCLYVIKNALIDRELYGKNKKSAIIYKLVLKILCSLQKDVIEAIKKEGSFNPPLPFELIPPLAEELIGLGMKMGEGWLLTAEMIQLIHEGASNIICTQPFGCLPNHIAGKGMMKPLKEKYPAANIVAIDYDSGAAKINQENRIKLMLSSAVTKEDKRPMFNR